MKCFVDFHQGSAFLKQRKLLVSIQFSQDFFLFLPCELQQKVWWRMLTSLTSKKVLQMDGTQSCNSYRCCYRGHLKSLYLKLCNAVTFIVNTKNNKPYRCTANFQSHDKSKLQSQKWRKCSHMWEIRRGIPCCSSKMEKLADANINCPYLYSEQIDSSESSCKVTFPVTNYCRYRVLQLQGLL